MRGSILRVLALVVLLASWHAPASGQGAGEMVQRAGDDVARAEAAQREFESVREANADAWNANPVWAARLENASSQLAEAKLRLQVGKTQEDTIQLTQASAVAMQASQEFEQLVRDIQAWRAPKQDREPEPKPEAPKTPEPKTPTPPKRDQKAEPKPPAKTDGSESGRDNVQDLTGKRGDTVMVVPESKPTSTPPPHSVSEPARPIASTPRPKTRRSSAPPADLYAAAGALFEGEYATALRLLDNISFDDSKSTAHAHLLRSAAEFSLYYADGEQDATLLEKAAADARRCHESNSELSPLPRFFSPRFVAFFQEQTAKE